MKVYVSPDVTAALAQRGARSAGWLVGWSAAPPVQVVACVEALSHDWDRERVELAALLPVGMRVVGSYGEHSAQGAARTDRPWLVVRVDDTLQAHWSALGGDEVVHVTASPVCPLRAVDKVAAVTLRCLVPRNQPLTLDNMLVRWCGALDGSLVVDKGAKVAACQNAECGTRVPHALEALHRHTPSSNTVPELQRAASNSSSSSGTDALLVNVIGYFAVGSLLADALQQLVAAANHVEWVWRLHYAHQMSCDGVALFQPLEWPFAVTGFVMGGEMPIVLRHERARRLGLSAGRRYFCHANQLDSGAWQAAAERNKLLNVHNEVALAHGLKGTVAVQCVEGWYEYCHYQQDKCSDDGWGCAYRSLQTLCSWLQLQGYAAASAALPSHTTIQQALVALGDKEAAFVGSKQWIGAVECSMLLSHWYALDCRTLHLPSGADAAGEAHVAALMRHFAEERSPVMVGGGVLAWTLLGVARSGDGDTRFLILDPHYTGADERKTIVKKGWVAWKPASVFRKDSFYNFCCPLVPREK